tara:strand:+ start:1349 stop:3238 length:1890 start_codon:yes stop_codon:yes gene_type:complete
MTKDQEYKLLFESWRSFVVKETKTQQQEKAELIDFIKSNETALTSDKIISHLNSQYEGFSELTNQQKSELSTAIDSELVKNLNKPYTDTSRENLANQVLSKVDQLYSKSLYTDNPKLSDDELSKMRSKAQEKFALGDRTLSTGEMAAITAAGIAAAAPAATVVGLGALGGWFVGKVKKLFGFGKDKTDDLTKKFGKGAAGGTAAAKAIKKAGGKNSLKWARNKAISKTTTKAGLKLTAKTAGKRALAFLGPIGATAAGAWLLYDLYDTFYADDKKKVDEASQPKGTLTQKQIDQKILGHIDQLKKDEEFWKAFTQSIGKEISKIPLPKPRKKGKGKMQTFGHPKQINIGFEDLPELTGKITTIGNIQHNLKGSKKVFADELLNNMENIGITNSLLQIALISAVGKESNYKGISEGDIYPYARLKRNSPNDSVVNRVYRRFKEQGFGKPTDEHLKAISGGGKNGPALFNIAYGYQYHRDETMTAQSHPVLVNGKINPALYDIKLPGWKYRGRGAVGVTYKDNYIRAARAGGIDFKELERRIMEVDEENKGKRGAHPLPGDIAIQLSLGYLKKKNRFYINKYGDPKTIEDAVEIAIRIIGGDYGGETMLKHYNNSVKFLKRNFRLTSPAVS